MTSQTDFTLKKLQFSDGDVQGVVALVGPPSVVNQLDSEFIGKAGITGLANEEDQDVQIDCVVASMPLEPASKEINKVVGQANHVLSVLNNSDTADILNEIWRILKSGSATEPTTREEFEQAKAKTLAEELTDYLREVMYEGNKLEEEKRTWEPTRYDEHLRSLIALCGDRSELEGRGSLGLDGSWDDSPLPPADGLEFAACLSAARLTHFLISTRFVRQYRERFGEQAADSTKPSVLPPATFFAESDAVKNCPLTWAELFGLILIALRSRGPLVDVKLIPTKADCPIHIWMSEDKNRFTQEEIESLREEISLRLSTKAEAITCNLEEASGTVTIELTPRNTE